MDIGDDTNFNFSFVGCHISKSTKEKTNDILIFIKKVCFYVEIDKELKEIRASLKIQKYVDYCPNCVSKNLPILSKALLPCSLLKNKCGIPCGNAYQWASKFPCSSVSNFFTRHTGQNGST